MIFTLDPLALPLCLLIWSIDSLLWLILLRLTLEKASNYYPNTLYQPLVKLTEPIPKLVDRCTGRLINHSVPSCLKWILIIISLFGLRYTLLMLVMSICTS